MAFYEKLSQLLLPLSVVLGNLEWILAAVYLVTSPFANDQLK